VAIASDTSADADAAQLEAYRRMGGAGRLEIAFRLTRLARITTEAGIRSRHPDYDDAHVKLALARLLYGDDLVRSAWPDRPLVDP
jgi:hypothetical protein